MKKVIKKTIGLLLLGYILYVILGALVPFINHPKVEKEFKDNFELSKFYNEEGTSVDRAKIVETATEALDIRLQMFEQAKEKIVLSTFDIRPGQSCTDIFSSLLAAADRGVQVQIFVDGLYGAIHMKKEPIFYTAGSHPNIEIRFYNIPNFFMPWTMNGRMHDKYILIDNKLLLLGGRNTFDYFLGDYTDKNLSYDREVLIYHTTYNDKKEKEESVISEVYSYFSSIWNSKYSKIVYNKPKGKKQKLEQAEKELKEHYISMKQEKPDLFLPNVNYEKITIPIKKATLITNPTHIYAKQPYVWYQIVELMKAAKERVYIQTPYAAFSKDMYNDFKEVSDQLNHFDMQINSVAVGDNFMASSDYILNKKKLLDTGVQIYEFQGAHSSHGKSFLFDDNLSIIGSYNLDMRSTYVDTETALVIHGEEFNQQLENYIMKMHEESLAVKEDGTYEQKEGVIQKKLKTPKKVIFSITSVLFQLIRYLI